MKPNYFKYLLIFPALILCFCKCHKNDPNPCASMHPTSADFTIQEYISPEGRKIYGGWTYWNNYATDTALFNVLHMEAAQDSASGTTYEWTIGKTKVYKKAFDISFSLRPPGNDHVTVQLKVTRQPDHACFPSDSGIATSSHQLVLLGLHSDQNGDYIGNYDSCLAKSAMAGTYVGQYLDIPFVKNGDYNAAKTYQNDTLIIRLGWNNPAVSLGYVYSWYYFSEFKRRNLSPTSNNWLSLYYATSSTAFGYKQFNSDENGDFFLTPDNNHIQCTYIGRLLFKGKRILN